MKHFSWRKVLPLKFGRRGPKRRQQRTWTPRLELLEERWVPTITATGQSIAPTPVEGTSGTFTVATFTDTNPGPPSAYSATIDWGDGTPTTTGTISETAGTFSVTGTHTYADETAAGSTLPVTVQITESADGDSGTANSTASVTEADSLTAAGTVNISATEGTAFSGTLATFTNTNTANTASDFTASITWGDGATTTGTVSGSGGSFSVSGTHTYAEDGSFTVNVTLADDSPSTQSATATGTASVAETDLTAPASTIMPTEGHTFNGAVATFTDTGSPDAAAAFSASIVWGDGTTTTGTVTGSGGNFSVSGTHVYADEGSFTGSVQITETGVTSGTASASLTATVAEGDALTGTGKTLTGAEGHSLSGAVATFTDTNTTNPAGDFTASIVWGDGTTTSGTVSGSAGNFTVSGTHTFAEDGSFTVGVTLTDDTPGTATATASSTANIAESDLTVTGSTIAKTEAQTFSGAVATFTDTGTADAASAFGASIVWGDGTTTTGTVTGSAGSFSVSGTHVYADEGTFTGSVQVTETGVTGGTASATLTANIMEGNTLTGTSKSLTGTEGHSFSGAVATFSDTNTTTPASDFTAEIVWGDGTSSAGSVSGSAGNFTVSGTHTFAEDGSFTVGVTLTDDSPGTAKATASSTSDIAESDLTATAATIPNTPEGQSFSASVATFTDTNTTDTASAFTASINWGDGTSSTGMVSGSSGSFMVKGTHTYADEGDFTVAVQITETGVTSGTASASATAHVTEADALAATGIAISANAQAFTGQVATFTTSYTGNTASDFSAMISWGDGSTTSGAVSGSNGNFSVTGSHTYANVGSFPVSVTIKDDGSGTASTTTSSTATATGTTWLDRVYRDFFHRTVDPVGQAGWTALLNQGVSRQLITLMIEQSVEYRTDEVQNLYQQLLHRGADAGGLNSYVNDLASGMTILQVEAAMLGSPEFFQNSGGTNQGFVNALFEIVLHRAPEPGAQGLAVNALNNNMSRQAIAAIVLSSDEFYMDLTNSLFEQFLLRAPEPGALSLSMQALHNGFSQEGLIAVLLGSQEYLVNTAD